MSKVNYVDLIDNLDLMSKDFANFKVKQEDLNDKRMEELSFLIQEQYNEAKKTINGNLKELSNDVREKTLDILSKDLKKHELDVNRFEELHKDSLARFSEELETVINQKLEDYKLRVAEIDNNLELFINDYRKKLDEIEMEKIKNLEAKFLVLKEKEVEITTNFMLLHKNIQSAVTNGFLFDDIHKKIIKMEVTLEMHNELILKSITDK